MKSLPLSDVFFCAVLSRFAWFNAGRHARSYRWAPHAFHPWCLRNAKLLKEGYDPDAIFIDVFTAHGPFDYLDRTGRCHSKNETSANWGRGFELYREGFRRPDAVCVSEAGQDHLVGVADAGQSDHFGAAGRMVAGVDAVEPEKGAAAPTWCQTGNVLKVTCDAKAFAYRIRLMPYVHCFRYLEFWSLGVSEPF